MRYYKDQLKEIRNWSRQEAGYRDDLPLNERKEALDRANALYEEAVKELEDIEADEEENYAKFDRRYKRSWDNAA